MKKDQIQLKSIEFEGSESYVSVTGMITSEHLTYESELRISHQQLNELNREFRRILAEFDLHDHLESFCTPDGTIIYQIDLSDTDLPSLPLKFFMADQQPVLIRA
jgi:hypothetical protein